ncbi:MAG: diacylglycerol/lipid kinase family protein, partial [Bryobacteraceae bacterium]
MAPEVEALGSTGASPQTTPQTAAAVIVNSHVGVGAAENAREQQQLLALLKQHGVEAKITSAAGGELYETARRLVSDGYRLVVAAGGDGTVSAVAAAVAGTDATLGVLPLGTLNHFAKDLRIPLDLAAAIRNLRTGTAEMVDVGT